MTIRYVSDLDCYAVTRWGTDEPFAWAETTTDAMAIQEMEAERAGADLLPNKPVDLGPDYPDAVEDIADVLFGEMPERF
jgi:hypothetical protein